MSAPDNNNDNNNDKTITIIKRRKCPVKPVFHQAEYFARSGKPIVFHRIPPKAYAEKSDQVQLFRRGKFRKPIILLTLRTT